MDTIKLPYNQGKLSTVVSPGIKVHSVGDVFPPHLRDISSELRRYLAAPVGSPPLSKLLPENGRVCLVVPDITRGGGIRRVLAVLLEELLGLGIGAERIDIVIANGMHPKVGRDRLRKHLGGRALDNFNVFQHWGGDPDKTVAIGVTTRKTPVEINRVVINSRLVICAGPVSFHYFAGFGGGRKLIMPGVAGEKSILFNHRLSLDNDPGRGLAEGCAPGVIENNPVHNDMMEAVRLMPKNIFSVNYVCNPDGKISYINAGEIEESHKEACKALIKDFSVELEKRYSSALVSAGGYPKDLNLLQTHKMMRYAARAVKKGGRILCIAACPEGIGSQSLKESFMEGPDGVPGKVRREYSLNSQTAVSMKELTENYSIYLKSMIVDEAVKKFGIIPWDGKLIDAEKGSVDLLVIDNGSYFLPVLRPDLA